MDSDFDVIIFGTGLAESITAAALSQAGFKIAHIDSNPYYGADEASLSLDELIQWADGNSRPNPDQGSPYMSSQGLRFTSISISRSSSSLPHGRQYCLSLSPSIIPAIGPFISSLISSGVSRYGGFRLLERIALYNRSGGVKHVPFNKEDVFKNKDIGLLDKRRLMRFLMFAAGEFEGKQELVGNEEVPFHKFLQNTFALNENMANAIAYSLAYCVLASDHTLPTLRRVRRYLRSAGRYGTSPFLVGHYGGLGEIAQGFCRSSAVSGGVYILGKRILSIDQTPEPLSSPEPVWKESPSLRYMVKLDDFPHDLTCDLIIASRNHLPSHLRHIMKYIPPSDLPSHASSASVIARCIAIIDRPIPLSPDLNAPLLRAGQTSDQGSPLSAPLTGQDDTSVLIFPPSSLAAGSSMTSVNVLITGEGSKSTPQGKLVIYISTLVLEPATSSPESFLRPYLDATLTLAQQSEAATPIQPLFTIFYNQELPPRELSPMPSQAPSSYLVMPVNSCLLPDSSDTAATNAEAVFWEAVRVLKPLQRQSSHEDTETQRYSTGINSFWPPPPDVDALEEWW